MQHYEGEYHEDYKHQNTHNYNYYDYGGNYLPGRHLKAGSPSQGRIISTGAAYYNRHPFYCGSPATHE